MKILHDLVHRHDRARPYPVGLAYLRKRVPACLAALLPVQADNEPHYVDIRLPLQYRDGLLD